jgi:hypothetical protein
VSEKFVKILKTILIILITIFVTYYSVIETRIQNEKNTTFALEKYAKDMNGECPIAVGNTNGLIISKVKFKEVNTVEYDYKFLNFKKDYFDLIKLRENLSKTVIEELESMQSIAQLRNKNVIFEYYFFDCLNEELVRLTVLFNTPITFIE